MKKIRFLSLLLVLTILLNGFSCMAFAGEEPSESQSTEASEASAEAPSESTQADAYLDPDGKVLTPGCEALPTPSEVAYTSDYHPAAKAAILIEMNSNTIVYSLDPDEKVYPASLTKMLTCILALEYGDLNDLLTVTDTALAGLDISGSTAGLQAGEQMSLRNILYCMMLSSANEACNVVAEYISGDVDSFITLMNEKAAALGCTGTHFANAHGLHDENHYTTVRDLSIIARYAWQNPTFREITSTATYTVPATNLSPARELSSTNYLINTSYTDKYYYSRAAGIKTGFTTPAGGCLVSTASYGDLEYLSVVCGCETVAEDDGSYTEERFVATKNLFEYGFDNFSYVQVATTLEMTASIPVTLSAGKNYVLVHPSEDIYSLLPNEYDKALITTDYSLYDGAQSLEAPLEAGQQVGTLTVSYNGTVLGTVPIETTTAVARSTLKYTSAQTRSFLSRYWWLFLLILLVLFLGAAILIGRARRKRMQRRREMHRRRPGQREGHE